MTTILPYQSNPRPRGGLESVAAPLMGADGQPLAEDEWRGGVGLTPPGDGETFIWPIDCYQPSIAEKPAQEGIEPLQTFLPFIIGASAMCEMAPAGGPLGDAQTQLATRALDLKRFSLLAQAMFDGAIGTDPATRKNPNLFDLTGVTAPGFLAATPEKVRPTVQGLLNAVCEFGGADWVFHANIQALPAIKSALGLTWDDERGVWTFGPFDWSFDCYPNLGPTEVEDDNATATDGTEAWIWLTRRPMVAWSADVQIGEARGYRINTRRVVAEQPAIVVFDPTAVRAAKALLA